MSHDPHMTALGRIADRFASKDPAASPGTTPASASVASASRSEAGQLWRTMGEASAAAGLRSRAKTIVATEKAAQLRRRRALQRALREHELQLRGVADG